MALNALCYLCCAEHTREADYGDPADLCADCADMLSQEAPHPGTDFDKTRSAVLATLKRLHRRSKGKK